MAVVNRDVPTHVMVKQVVAEMHGLLTVLGRRVGAVDINKAGARSTTAARIIALLHNTRRCRMPTTSPITRPDLTSD